MPPFLLFFFSAIWTLQHFFDAPFAGLMALMLHRRPRPGCIGMDGGEIVPGQDWFWLGKRRSEQSRLHREKRMVQMWEPDRGSGEERLQENQRG